MSPEIEVNVEAARIVLFLHPSAELYGADRALLQIIAGLDRERWRAVVALPRTGPLRAALEEAGARVVIGPLGIAERASLKPAGLVRLALELPRALRFVRGLVRSERPALVHTNTLIVLGGALAAWSTRTPHLWHLHEIFVHPAWLLRALARTVEKLSTRVVANSRATAECFAKQRPSLRTKLGVIHNGIEPRSGLCVNSKRRARAELGLDPTAPLVVLVGRINAWKGQALLVDAAARLAAAHPTARYVFVGDAPPGQDHFVRELHAAIRAHGLATRVDHWPFTENVTALYDAADVVCVPSLLPEPFGLVAIEAMAAGRPVVAADHGGLTEIVVHEQTGLLVPPGDASALAAALDRLLSDPARAAELGRSGAERQRTAFDVARYSAAFAAEYAALAPAPFARPVPSARPAPFARPESRA